MSAGPDHGVTVHWAADQIGLPWVAGVSDCRAFATMIWRERFGFDAPLFAGDPGDPRAVRRAFAHDPGASGWSIVAHDPREGDGVLMAKGARPCHVGVWIDPGPSGVLHSVEGAGVIFTPPAQVAALGYRIVGIYRRCAP
ncbi:MAG: hypothetical protein Q7J57_05490 [Gemmobacter sp.]|nr:hypothetical protein [Gemmobacter sp.]